MAYEVVMPYHLHMPSYFLETFTEYPKIGDSLFFNCMFIFYRMSLRCYTNSSDVYA